ncbi:MAG: Gfo/Idh/MocA family oxidoreductase [Alphaproteobacteria bacterium]
MSKAKVRTGIIGAGFGATFHYQAALRVPGIDVEVVGVHAKTPASTESFSRARGIEAFSELEAMLDRIDALTQLPDFMDHGHIRADYVDIEDFVMTHVTFQDGTIATVFASDIVLGGVHNWLEVCAGNYRTICNLNPSHQMQTYNPVDSQFDDIYVVEKIGTKQGWAPTAPDEDFSHGFPQEIEAFYGAVAYGGDVESNSELAADCIATIYSGYVSARNGGAEEVVTLL